MIELTLFLDREYEFSRYNCGHFVCDVWHYITREDIKNLCKDFLTTGFGKTRSQREKLKDPESPCLVVMRRKNYMPHVGVYYDGRVIHLTKTGVVYQALDFLPTDLNLSFFK